MKKDKEGGRGREEGYVQSEISYRLFHLIRLPKHLLSRSVQLVRGRFCRTKNNKKLRKDQRVDEPVKKEERQKGYVPKSEKRYSILLSLRGSETFRMRLIVSGTSIDLFR